MTDKNSFKDVTIIDLEEKIGAIQNTLKMLNEEKEGTQGRKDLEAKLSKDEDRLRESILNHIDYPLYQTIHPASILDREQMNAGRALRESLERLSKDPNNETIAAETERFLQDFTHLLDPEGSKAREERRLTLSGPGRKAGSLPKPSRKTGRLAELEAQEECQEDDEDDSDLDDILAAIEAAETASGESSVANDLS